MQKKTFLQLLLLAIILVISFSVYKKYFQNEILETNREINNLKKDEFNTNELNLIKDIKYIAQGNNGEEYIIYSKFGELMKGEPNLILMKEVVAIINDKNSASIKISGDNALYNKLNYDTNFYDNVVVVYNESIITSDNMDFSFKENLATISNNVIYKNLNTKLEADKIEIDLITKNSKIFMNDKSKKVKIESQK